MIFKKINFPFFPPIPRNYNENDFSLRPPITVIRFGAAWQDFSLTLRVLSKLFLPLTFSKWTTS